jgi:hypothetical protein
LPTARRIQGIPANKNRSRLLALEQANKEIGEADDGTTAAAVPD